jgi:hypothetical protein
MRDKSTAGSGKSPRCRRLLIAPLAGAVLALAVFVPAASARTATLHYFSKETSSTFVTPQGKPLGPNSAPAVGDINDNTDVDYVGNHKQHAKQSTASDHLRCTITGSAGNSATAICDAQIAIGGSMLLANHVKLTFSESNAPIVVPINGGTGIYRHAHGTVISTSVGNNSDLTVKVTY